MKVTISTHNGSAVAREHNIRNPKVVSNESHIDMERPHETWIDEPIREAYKRLFGKSVETYNAKQKRSDRKIKSYYKNICDDKSKHPVYEMIVGIYIKDDDGSIEDIPETKKAILRKFVDNWKERNPNLEIIGAYLHDDEEGDMHVHIDYIPVAYGYTRGMEIQTALNKALEQQGFVYENAKATPQIKWQNRENAYLTQLCEDSGLTVEHPKDSKKHLATDIYKLQKQKEEAEIALNEVSDRMIVLQSECDRLKDDKAEAEITIAEMADKLTAMQAELDGKQQEFNSLLTFLNIPKPPQATFKEKPVLVSRDEYIQANTPEDFEKLNFFKRSTILKALEKSYQEKTSKHQSDLRLYEAEQVEREEYLKKYSQLVNLQERERQLSEEIKEKAEKLAITISEDRILTEHKKRLDVQGELKELEEAKKKQDENYKKNIQLLQKQLQKEQELTYRIAQYIADMESLEYSDDEEMIKEVNDFVTKEQERMREEEKMDFEPPDYW
ncbi:MAG: plasmid recombination protein [Lachnospiraceae bacterium]|nr:plasmid recombination protein [Lachnospiraceae bacterium]